MLFKDRADAGQRLAEALRHVREERPVVLGLPRGGVPVAYEVARALGTPLDVIVVRKLGALHQRELALGAIGEDGVRVISDEIVRLTGAEPADIAAAERAEEAELVRQARQFRAGRTRVPLTGRTVILVDDGIATGATAAAACAVARAHGASRVVLAVPTAPPDAVARLRGVADEVVCLSTPGAFRAVSEWYVDFSQTEDEEVVSLLARAKAYEDRENEDRENGEDDLVEDVEIGVALDTGGTAALPGELVLPAGAGAIVLFAHGSGSSRHSPRNRSVAAALNRAGLGTLLFDLLTPAEEARRANVFAIEPLARRLAGATDWLRRRSELPLGYFGASTGAAAALWAAAGQGPGAQAGAVVSRGGRPDLAASRLADVRAPTLLIVGGDDAQVLDLNRRAQAELRCESRLEVVPGATHLFEEPGALAEVADLAQAWFLQHLTRAHEENA